MCFTCVYFHSDNAIQSAAEKPSHYASEPSTVVSRFFFPCTTQMCGILEGCSGYTEDVLAGFKIHTRFQVALQIHMYIVY